MLPEGLRAQIDKGSWPVLPIFKLLQSAGNIGESEMFSTFNMGIGMVIAVNKGTAREITDYLNREETQAYTIGKVVKGESGGGSWFEHRCFSVRWRHKPPGNY